MKITFIGLGNMGTVMAQNLINAGYPLQIYNRNAAKAEALKGDFKSFNSVKEACAGQELIITMLADDQALYELTEGEDGILAAMQTDAIHLSMSTIAAGTSRDLYAKHKDKQTHYLTAPVFGRPEAAAAAKLFICVSGDDSIKQRVKPVLDVLGQSVTDFGTDAGAANVVKLSGNFMLMASMEMMAEAFTLAEKQGLNRMQVAEFFGNTMFNNAPIYQKYGTLIAEKKYQPVAFKAHLGFKDIRLASEMALDAKMPAPLMNIVYNRLLSAVAKGKGEIDWIEGVAGGVSEDAGI